MNDEQKAKLAKAEQKTNELKELVSEANNTLMTKFINDFNRYLDEVRARAIVEGERRQEDTEKLIGKVDELIQALDGKEFDQSEVIEAWKKWTETSAEHNLEVFNDLADMIEQIKNIKNEINVEAPKVTLNSMDKYLPADVTKKHSGYLANDGSWFIGEQSGRRGAKTFRYVSGKGDYVKAWANRHDLEYKYMDEVKL